MAFDAKQFRQKAKMELSTRNGGNLRKKSKKIPQDQITVFIGLGGLGGRAINAIKGVAAQKLDNADRRFFLAIDTDLESMKNISETTTDDLTADAQHGWMTEDEKCSLFNEMNSYTVAELPHDIDDWVDRENMDTTVISGQGAHAVRQVGRIMLFSKGNYDVVYNKISDIIQKATAQRSTLPGTLQNGKIKVYIVAGISGGTGSGTIVDISYMVRKILNQYGMATFNVEGVLFTPDVQENDRNMQEEDRLKNKRNFYAAIKEVDYYYHNKTLKKAYSCPTKGNDPAYEYDIFDSCTIISRFSNGRVMANDSSGVIDKAANAIVYEISSVRAANTGTANAPLMALSSYMDNEPALVSTWLSTPNGQSMQIPEWTPPRYSSLGYGSFYVPRDELLAYCANKLMKELMDTWNKNILDSKAAQKFMTKYGIGSLRGFAAKLFEYAEASRLFDVPHKDMPRDPDSIGLMKVKNCCSYLDDMKEIAEDEGQEVKVKQLVKDAAMKTDGGIVNPLCTHFDKAFLNELPNTGPAYAVRLLASIDPSNPGILANLQQMLNHIQDEFRSWDADLAVTYNMLYKRGEEFEEKSSVDKNELEDFTAQCREYGEKLLQSKMLQYSYEVLSDVYNKINAKNNELFNIYTVTLEYLVEMLQEDSAYVTNPQRCREGNNTVFSFDIVNFEDGDAITQKFMTLFDGLVDNMDIQKKSADFVDNIFKQIKLRLATSKTSDKQFTEDDVLDVIRNYFANAFELWTDDVIERFCIIAYSQLDINTEDLTKIWSDDTKADARNTALANTARTIQLQLTNAAGVLLTTSDETKDVENFSGYTALMGIPETNNINNYISGITKIDSCWSEFVIFKRRGGIPLSFINGLEDCQKVYNDMRSPGQHLDEVGDNWKINLPEPYGYNIRKHMGKYVENGFDQVEYDKQRMTEILKLSQRAKELGLLVASQDTVTDQNILSKFYNMYHSFVSEIDVDAKKTEIAEKLKATVLNKMANGSTYDMHSVLVDSGYTFDKPIGIRRTYNYSQLNGLMADATVFGNEVVFGNFITLIRSNYDWYVKLKNAVELFEKINTIYQDVLAEIEKESRFTKGLTTLVDAIKVNRFVPFYINNVVSGFEIRMDNDSTKYVRFLNDGFKAVDNYFLLYLAYVKCFMMLDDTQYKVLTDLMTVDFSIDKHVDWEKASRSNVDWFIEATDSVINDKEMLNHFSESLLIEKLTSLLKYSKFDYSLPEASDNNKNVSVVIKNLKYFYNELRNVLKSNRIDDKVSFTDDDQTSSGSTQMQSSDSATWICPTCGKVNDNSVNFCPVDGTKKIVPQKTWVCPTCGKVNDDNVKFCPVDGTKKIVPQKTWVCPTCGKVNDDNVRFCPEDGTRKPELNSKWFCPKCGKENDADVNFCPVDGTKKI